MANLSHGLSGVAGEYYVCAELSRRGYLATLTLKNAEGIDILTSRPKSGRAITIQVKTIQGKKAHWVLNEKHEHHQTPNLFYIFVRLGPLGERPAFHIVPSSIVATHISHAHKKWVGGRKKDGSSRKDTAMRGFSDHDNEYQERWELLE